MTSRVPAREAPRLDQLARESDDKRLATKRMDIRSDGTKPLDELFFHIGITQKLIERPASSSGGRFSLKKPL